MPDPAPSPLWQPRYTMTPAVVRALLEIEAARAVVDHTPFPPAVTEELRRRARIRSTHYSTRIEGNRLTLAKAEEVLPGSRTHFHGRERDVGEVRNYWNSLLRVEEWAAREAPLTEELIQRLHAMVEHGPRAKPTPYRDGQNVSLEEYHARDLAAYYGSLATHPHHNYYEGRAGTDLTPWLEYFLGVLAAVFEAAQKEALQAAGAGFAVEPELLRDWVEEGFLEVVDASRRGRAYTLSAVYRQFIGNLSAMGGGPEEPS